jgi:hypothetical protein
MLVGAASRAPNDEAEQERFGGGNDMLNPDEF